MKHDDNAEVPSIFSGTATERHALAALAAATDKRLKWYILLACCLASAAKMLEPPIWIFNPPIAMPFEAAWRDYRFFASFASLVTVTFLLAGGVLGDLHGRRRLMLIGLTGYVAGNLFAMTVSEPGWHLFARFIAVAFGAAAIPLALGMINLLYHGRELSIAIAAFTIINTLATQIAWVQGQFLLDLVGWRAPYVLPSIVAVVAILLIRRFMPETMAGQRRFMDTIVYTGWTMIILSAFFVFSAWPIDDDRLWIVLLTTLVIGGIGTGLVIWWNHRIRSENGEKPRFRMRDVTALIVTGAILSFALVGYGVRTFAYFQLALSMSDILALIALAPILIGSIAGLLIIVKAVRTYQARLVIACGLLVMAAAIVMTALLPLGASYFWFIIPLFLFGASYLVSVTVWISAFLRTAVDGYYGLNAGINRATGMLGGAIGASVTGNMLAVVGINQYKAILAQLQLTPTEVTEAEASFYNVVSANPVETMHYLSQYHNQLLGNYLDAYGAAYDTVLVVIAVLCAATAIIIGFGLRRSVRAEQYRQQKAAEAGT